MISTLRRVPFQHATSIAFLLITAILLAGALGGVVRGARLSAFIPVGIAGALIGWLPAYRGMKGWLAWIGIVFLGIAFLWGSTAQLGAPIWELIASLPSFAYQSFQWFWDPQTTLDFSLTSNAWNAIVTQSWGLWQHLVQWFPNIQNSSSRYDPVVYILTWSFFLWLVMAWEGWFLYRGSVLTATVPSLLLLAEVLYLTTVEIGPLWIMLCITLLLMGLTHFRLTFASWIKRHVDYAEIILDTTISMIFVMALLLSAIAWVTPSISIQQIVDAVRNHSVQARPGSKSLNDTLGLKSPPQKSAGSHLRGTAPTRHMIGAGPEASQDVVMIISTGEIPPGQAYSPSLVAPYHRWRSFTLDRYIGSGWSNTPVESFLYDSDVQVFQNIPDRYRTLRQSVRFAGGGSGSLYWDGILQSVNQPFEVDWRVKPETDPPVNASLLGNADMFGAYSKDSFYQATSLIPIIDAQKLRTTSGDYPVEIRTHYLLLPESVPDRVLTLAREITATAPTPYDEAKAIEKYLRKTYPYTLNIPAPPSDRDVVDYFLFDLKKGFCDYYATAMVVMARAVGLPARIVFGYAGGTYDFNAAEYTVVQANAHAWVEVYFPQVGWVEFDPTANQPAIEHPLDEEIAGAGPNIQPGGLGNWTSIQSASIVAFTLWSLLGAMGLAIAVVLFQLGEIWLLTRMEPIQAMRTMYRGLYFVGRRVAGSGVMGETADEFAASLRQRLNDLSQKESLRKLFSPATSELNRLTDLYLRAIYTPRPPEKNEVHAILHTWQALRWRLLLANVVPNRKSQIQNRKS